MRTMYLIQRRGWDAQNWRKYTQLAESLPYQKYFEEEEWEDFRNIPVAVTSTLTEANKAIAQLEVEARRDRNPFWFDTPWTQPPKGFFTAIGVEEPPVQETRWENSDELLAWWDEHSPTWTDEQRNAVWDLFDNLRFYDVTEIPLED